MAFRWMSGRASRIMGRSERLPANSNSRAYLEGMAYGFSEAANRLKMFSEMPQADVTRKLATNGPNPLSDIIGKWPGTETDEEIDAALKALDPGEASP